MGTIGDIEKEEEEKEIAMKDTELIPGEELVKSAYNDSEMKLIKFVQQNIELMKQKLLSQAMPTLPKVNQNLLAWAGESFSLNILYQRAKYDADRVKKE
jgi:hypothetical protein